MLGSHYSTSVSGTKILSRYQSNLSKPTAQLFFGLLVILCCNPALVGSVSKASLMSKYKTSSSSKGSSCYRSLDNLLALADEESW